MPGTRRLGSAAEDRAAEYLASLGYTLVTRRFKARRGELDLVVLDGDILVFVEVKERRTGQSPEMATGDRKLERMARAANQYVAETEQFERSCRFDIVAIDEQGLRHYQDVLGS